MNKSIYIVGAGGCGREVYAILKDLRFMGYRFAGFLDDDPNALQGWKGNGRVVGSIAEERPAADKLYVLAVGTPSVKKDLALTLGNKGAEFVTVVHPTAIVNETAQIGKGCIVYPYTVVSDSVKTGDFVLLNIAVSLGHDTVVGEYSTLCAHCDITGHAKIGCTCYLSSSTVVVPSSKIGNNVFVGAGSVVIGKIADNMRVSGNPALKMRTWG